MKTGDKHMPLHLRENQYRGVNAHLHSDLQNDSDAWSVFHGTHSALLAFEIDALLPPGYIAEPERGPQIKPYHPVSGEDIRSERIRRHKPDITIYASETSATTSLSSAGSITAPTIELPAIESLTLDEEAFMMGIAIREVSANKLGKPVTWIELLSPTNKSGGSGYNQYHEGRESTLRASIALVEIDYLHQSPPVIPRIPSYPAHEAGGYPYYIAVTNPRPNFRDGLFRVYGIEVDSNLPIVPIPLADEESFNLDFGPVYHRTFASLAAFSRRVDYEQEPVRVDTYTEIDQQKIRARMETVKVANQA
jgi:hypothetical protein